MIMAEDCRSLSPTFADMDMDGSFEDFLDLAEVGDSDVTSDFTYRYAPNNAVHMEIQNNAMLPTFNLNVDRTNSSSVPRLTSQQRYSPTTRKDIEEMMRLSENDFSLTEVFLKSRDRTSQNMNYSGAGALLSSTSDSKANGETEVKPSALKSTASHGTNPDPQSNTTDANLLQLQYYRRPQQLPIPAPIIDPEPKVDTTAMKDAVVIAAAIVSQSQPQPQPQPQPQTVESEYGDKGADSTPVAIATLPPTTTPTAPISSAGPPPASTVATLQSFQFPPPRSATTHPTASYPYSRLNAAAAAPTPQMLAATMQRSQFGFGDNHQVPCVPNPPQRASAVGKKKKGKSSPDLPPTPPPANSGPAYERKKQRAKDARCKLNDSIESMSIAMSLAGTQSQQRAAVHTDPETRKVMEECAETAESAKKWDRPGFVGTAASLIMCLNSQCEALVRELKKHEAVLSMNGCHKRTEAPDQEMQQELHGKRQKIESVVENENVNFVFSDRKILRVVASFLCPQSLLRCQRLSGTIRDSFSQESLWLDRCIQRFGMFNVRQWKEKLDDADDNSDGHRSGGSLSSCDLYQMDSHNVRPLHSNSQLVVLAEARMTQKVSAWVSMVERSNGETSRSVRQSDGRYTSLPVVELHILIQNTGSVVPISIKEQVIVVDASTRRRGEEWKEVMGDGRFAKRMLDTQGVAFMTGCSSDAKEDELVRLRLFESVLMVVHMHCKGCSTSSKFQQRANFTKVLVQLNGTTVPLVIPFFREGS